MTQEPKKRPSNTPHPEKFDENKFLMYTYYNGEFTDNLFENHFLLTASNVNFSTTLFMCKNCQGMMNFTEMLIHECTECNICMDTMKKRVRCSQCSGTMCGACASKLQKCPFCRMSLALLPAPLPIGTEEEEGEVPVWVEDEFRRVTEEIKQMDRLSFIRDQKNPRRELDTSSIREDPHTEVPIMDPLDIESWEEIRGRKEKNRERREHEQVRNEMGTAWHPSAASYHLMKSSKPACECHLYPPPHYLIRGPNGEIVTQKRVGMRNLKFGMKPENFGDTLLTPDGFRYEHHCHQHDVHQIHVYRPHAYIPGSIEAVGGEKNIH